jgi:RNA polymerase sigma factor (sigma-70 family)
MTPVLAQGLRADRSFERMYRRHVGDVYRYALAVLRNPADAEDVTQTTFLNAYRAFRQGERPRHPQNWLIAIAHNVCRQRFRQAARRVQEVELDENAAEWLEDDDSGPTADDLRRALGHLAFKQRAALVMRELEGRSYAEIAEILGLSVSAVETLLFRARQALREQLAGSLTCAEAERALSREADGQLARPERGALRAHLRECPECRSLARSQRAQRSAWKTLGALPVPASLSSLFGGGGAAVGVKAAAVAASAVVAGGAGLAGERHFAGHHSPAKPRAHAVAVAQTVHGAQLTHARAAAAAHAVAHRGPAVDGRSRPAVALERQATPGRRYNRPVVRGHDKLRGERYARSGGSRVERGHGLASHGRAGHAVAARVPPGRSRSGDRVAAGQQKKQSDRAKGKKKKQDGQALAPLPSVDIPATPPVVPRGRLKPTGP